MLEYDNFRNSLYRTVTAAEEWEEFRLEEEQEREEMALQLQSLMDERDCSEKEAAYIAAEQNPRRKYEYWDENGVRHSVQFHRGTTDVTDPFLGETVAVGTRAYWLDVEFLPGAQRPRRIYKEENA